MPNRGGLIYLTQSEGVSGLADIQHVLGETVNELGALCRSDRINKWSKHKPVRSSLMKKLSDADFRELNYGLSMGRSTSPDLVGGVDYIRPDSLCRPLDFDGYYHNAHPPISSSVSGSLVLFNDGTAKRYALGANAAEPVDDQYEITISDLADLAGRYLAIVWNDDGQVRGITATAPLSEANGYHIDFPSGILEGGTFDAYVVASEYCSNGAVVRRPKGLSTLNAWGTFCALPFNDLRESSLKVFSWAQIGLTLSIQLGLSPSPEGGLVEMPEFIRFYATSVSDTDRFYCTGNAGENSMVFSILEYKIYYDGSWHTRDCSSYGYNVSFNNDSVIATTSATKIYEDSRTSHLIYGENYYVSKIGFSDTSRHSHNLDFAKLRSRYIDVDRSTKTLYAHFLDQESTSAMKVYAFY